MRIIDTDVRSKKGWDTLITSPFMHEMVDEVYRAASEELRLEAEKVENYPQYSDYAEYFSNGNRLNYEKKYFIRRKKLNIYFLLYKLCITIDEWNEKNDRHTSKDESCVTGGIDKDVLEKKSADREYENETDSILNSENVNDYMYIYNDKEIYKKQLENTIWQICDEYTWALPAHVNREDSTEMQIATLDLFAAETGFALSEILYILDDEREVNGKIFNGYTETENIADKSIVSERTVNEHTEVSDIADKSAINNKKSYINSNVVKRIRYEIKRRIKDPFLYKRTDNWWEHTSINWAAVCASCIGHVFIYEGTEEEQRLAMCRILECMKNYIDGFDDDGGCLEGYGYWNYGFGFFSMFMETYSDWIMRKNKDKIKSEDGENKCDYGENLHIEECDKYYEKIHNIAGFYEKVRLNGNMVVTFSDVPTEVYRYDIGIVSNICDRYGDYDLPDIEYRTHFGDDECYRFAIFVRNYIWSGQYIRYIANYSKDTTNDTTKNTIHNGNNISEYYFKNCGWFIKRADNYSFAIKGGDNGEPHNHNDLASFILTNEDSYIFCDCGAGEYTSESFDEATRYNIFVNSSFSHSTLIIEDTGQKNGHEYCSQMTYTDDVVSVDFTKAYDIAGIKKLERRIRIGCDGQEISKERLIIKDEYIFEDEKKIKDRIVTPVFPVDKSDGIHIKNVLLKYDKAKLKTVINKVVYSGHFGDEKTIYTIDFVPVRESKHYKLKYSIYFLRKMY